MCATAFSVAAHAEDWQSLDMLDGAAPQYDRDRVFRIGEYVQGFMRDELSAGRLKGTGLTERESAVRLSCKERVGQLLYIELEDRQKRPTRIYAGNDPKHYALMPERAFNAGTRLEKLQQTLCALPPEKLINLARNENDEWTQIDTSSIRRRGEHFQAWLRFDFPVVGFDPPFDAPYGSKRELYEINCAKGEWAMLAGYDFDENEILTDGRVDRELSFAKVEGTDKAALEFVCSTANPSLATGIGGAVLRPKQRIAAEATQTGALSVPEAIRKDVAEAVRAANLPPLRVKRVVLETSSTYQGKNPEKSLERRIFASAAEGLTLTTIHSSSYQSTALSIAGFIVLQTSQTSSEGGTTALGLQDVSFPNLRALAQPNQRFSYRESMGSQARELGRSRWVYDTACDTAAPIQARTLHPQLTGEAIPITCATNMNGEPANKTEGYFIVGAGWYFRARSSTEFYNGETRLVEVELLQ